MLRFVRLAPVGLLFLGVGCSDSTGPVSLTLNRMRWDQQNLHDYSYTSKRSCFFCPESGQEVVVAVMADTVFSATVLATGAQLPRDQWNTVPQLFDFVESALDDNYASVKVDYDSELGYPTRIHLSCDDTVLDCGYILEAKNLTPFDRLD